MMIDDILFLP
jgi:hypothetical protein